MIKRRHSIRPYSILLGNMLREKGDLVFPEKELIVYIFMELNI
jgi:hypothetical protein